MLITTRGIALSLIRYSDNKIIVKIFTEHSGMQSYIVYCGGKNRKTFRMFSQAAVIEIVALHKNGRDLQQIKEVSYSFIPVNISFDIRKSSIAMFIKELISACVKEHEPNKAVFAFFEKTFMNLDVAESGLSAYHLRFMAEFASYLGFMPENTYSADKTYFDMTEGLFVNEPPGHAHFMSPVQSLVFHELIQGTHAVNYNNRLMYREFRDEMLHLLIDFYRIHLPGMGKVNSHEILREVLAG